MVAILVPCYNEERTIAKTIESLFRLDYPKDKLKILIIDDGSLDRTYEIAKSLGRDSRLQVYHKENGGKYTALNYGLKKTNAEFIGTLDADSFVEPLALKKMLPYFSESNTQAVTSSLKVYHPKTALQHIQNIEYLFGIFLKKSLALIGSINVTPGPLTLFRKKVFDKIGPYRKAYDTEDLEMGLRLQSYNYQIENAIGACVYTVTPPDFLSLYLQRVRWYQGLLRNGWDYRYLINKKHGNLGIFILPITFLAIFFLMSNSIIFVTHSAIAAIKTLSEWASIGFDFSQLRPRIEWFFLDPNSIIFVALLSLLMTIFAAYVGHRFSNDHSKLGKGLILSAIFYGPLYASWWCGAIFKVALNKKTYWTEHKSRQYKRK